MNNSSPVVFVHFIIAFIGQIFNPQVTSMSSFIQQFSVKVIFYLVVADLIQTFAKDFVLLSAEHIYKSACLGEGIEATDHQFCSHCAGWKQG